MTDTPTSLAFKGPAVFSVGYFRPQLALLAPKTPTSTITATPTVTDTATMTPTGTDTPTATSTSTGTATPTAIPIPAGPVTIDYTYDPLYRLTAADYSTGDPSTGSGQAYYRYTYDSVGNRLTEESKVDDLLSVVDYTYDEANRLTRVDDVAYTWDANGNLLSDGVNTYEYDSANRLISVSNPSSVTSYQYNGLGDRLAQNNVHYTLDLNAGLTQVLDDGTNTYLYGNGRISQSGSVTEYFMGDALGSVRQLTNEAAEITLTKAYEPYGEETWSYGAGQSAFAFTGEAVDANRLVYLRARFYNPLDGRFLSRDPSKLERNLYLYTNANPINRNDPSGLDSGLLGPWSFSMCFDLHSVWMGSYPWISAAGAIAICRTGFQKDAWDPSWFDFTKPPESAHDLMGWYLYEQGKERMWFDGDSPLTQELAKSTLISDIRLKYYRQGDLTGQNLKEFGYGAFIRSLLKDSLGSITKKSLPISFFLGSFKYQVVTMGDRVGFRIDNRTDLESGTHIVGRFPGDEYGGSVEELLMDGYIQGSDSLADAVNKEVNGKKVVSILSARTRRETSNPLGGGNLEQVYTWTESRNDCFWWLEYITYVPMGPLSAEIKREIKPWPDYRQYTQNVTWP